MDPIGAVCPSVLQTDIVKRLFRRRSCHEIVRELALRPRTAHTQAHRLYAMFGVSRRIQLILRVLVSLRRQWEQEQISTCKEGR